MNTAFEREFLGKRFGEFVGGICIYIYWWDDKVSGSFFFVFGNFDAHFSLTGWVFFRVCSEDAGLPVVSAKFMKWHLRRSFLKLAIKEGGVGDGRQALDDLVQVFWFPLKKLYMFMLPSV